MEHTAAIAVLLLLGAASHGGVSAATSARRGDIVLDSTDVLLGSPRRSIEVRSPDGALRGKVTIPAKSKFGQLRHTAVTRKMAFTTSNLANQGTVGMVVSSISSYKIMATPTVPKLTGELAACEISIGEIAAAATTDPAVTDVYLHLYCNAFCFINKVEREGKSYIAAFRYSSATKQLSGPSKVYPLFSRSQCAKRKSRHIFLEDAPTIIGGVPYALAFDPRPRGLYKLTTAGPLALGPNLNLPDNLKNSQTNARCLEFRVAGTASFYANCDTGKRIGSRQLPVFAIYQFRKNAPPRIVGKLPASTSIYDFGFSFQQLATTPGLNTLYVVGNKVAGGPGYKHSYSILSLDKTKISTFYRRRWAVPQSLSGRVALQVVP